MTHLTDQDIQDISALLEIKNSHFPISEREEYQHLKTFSTKEGFYEFLVAQPVSSSLSLKLIMEEEISRTQKINEQWVHYFIHQNKKNMKDTLDELMPILPYTKEWGFVYALSSYIDKSNLSSSDLKDFYDTFKYRIWPVMTSGSFHLPQFQELASSSETKFIQHARDHEFLECLKIMHDDPSFLPKNTSSFLWSTLHEEDFTDIKLLTNTLSQAKKDFHLPLSDVLPEASSLMPLMVGTKKMRKNVLNIFDTLGHGERPDLPYLQEVFALDSQHLLVKPKEFFYTCQLFSNYIPQDFPFMFHFDFDDDSCEKIEPTFWKKTVDKALKTLNNHNMLPSLPSDIVGLYGLCAEVNHLPFERHLITSLPSFGDDYRLIQQRIYDYFDGLEPKEEDIDHFFSTYEAYVLKNDITQSLASKLSSGQDTKNSYGRKM